jgi:hypothetical protein
MGCTSFKSISTGAAPLKVMLTSLCMADSFGVEEVRWSVKQALAGNSHKPSETA